MHTQLNHIIAQQRAAELDRVGATHRPEVQQAPAGRRIRLQTVRRISSAFARLSAARA